MEHTGYEQLLERTVGLKDKLDGKLSKTLELDLLERIIKRLAASECAECAGYLPALSAHLASFEQQAPPGKQTLKDYRKTLAALKAHLQTGHQLYPEGSFTALYMSLGMSIGMAFGLALFKNIALGLPMGMAMGLAVGAGLDADLKKKGKTL